VKELQGRFLRDQRGVTYLMVMFAIVLMGISLSVVGKQWVMTVKRDHEAELLFRGTRIQNAIARYAADYEIRKATRPNRYPLSLEELTQRPKRYLQVVYKDRSRSARSQEPEQRTPARPGAVHGRRDV